ncbi:MAG: hypothetical protein EBR69_04765 [Synechococcaceae bacterium WB4_2_0805]|nr:hypothetical protein [Synechococcaceae bacterium WB4_2_0805]
MMPLHCQLFATSQIGLLFRSIHLVIYLGIFVLVVLPMPPLGFGRVSALLKLLENQEYYLIYSLIFSY